jgi:hypothetical protein
MNMKYKNPLLSMTITVFLLTSICSGSRMTAQTDTLENRSQFLFPDFGMSLIKLKTGEAVTTNTNFNIVTGRMTFYQNNKYTDLNKPEAVDTIFLQNKRFIYYKSTFLEVVVNAPVSLYIQHKGELKSTGRPGAYGIKTQTAGPNAVSQLVTNTKIYDLKVLENYIVIPSLLFWVKFNNKMNCIQSERQFLKLFPSNEDKIKQFISQSHLNLKSQDDMIALVIYCNRLIQ